MAAIVAEDPNFVEQQRSRRSARVGYNAILDTEHRRTLSRTGSSSFAWFASGRDNHKVALSMSIMDLTSTDDVHMVDSGEQEWEVGHGHGQVSRPVRGAACVPYPTLPLGGDPLVLFSKLMPIELDGHEKDMTWNTDTSKAGEDVD